MSANASTVHVVRDLWQDDALRYAVAQQAVVAASDAETADSLRVPDNILESFPLGWEGEDPLGRDDGLPDWGAEGWIAHRARVVGHRCGRVARGTVLVRSAEPGGAVAGDGEEAGGWGVVGRGAVQVALWVLEFVRICLIGQDGRAVVVREGLGKGVRLIQEVKNEYIVYAPG